MIEHIKKNKTFFTGGIIILSLAAAGFVVMPGKGPSDNSKNVRTICHYDGAEKGTFTEMTLNANGWQGHGDHAEDLWDVEVGSCPPRYEPEITNEAALNKRRLCHENPNGSFNELYLNANGWQGHSDHGGDLWDVEEDSCPA